MQRRDSSWRKSSRSGGDNGSQCVELNMGPVTTGIRDSKAPEHGTILIPTRLFAELIRSLA